MAAHSTSNRSSSGAVFSGQSFQVAPITSGNDSDGLLELKIDLQGESVNKFNQATVSELRDAVKAIQSYSGLRGVLMTSGKDVFIVGADVTEFMGHFKKSEAELASWLGETNELFNQIEDLPVPTVCAINGICLGGGFEVALSFDFRLLSEKAKVGLPETKLGIYPGWGGTVRLSRISGADNAIEWIAGGNQYGAQDALRIGAADGVVAHDRLYSQAIELLNDAARERMDWKSRRQQKLKPLSLNKVESMMVFEGAKGFIAGQAGPHYPAPVAAVEAMQKGALLSREEAQKIEAEGFAKVAKTDVAHSLVSLFLGDQILKKTGKKLASSASRPVKRAAVLGAGIMGGGIAYQSASKGIPIFMKDIRHEALELGMTEASKLLNKQIERGKINHTQMAQCLNSIQPTLSFSDDWRSVDLVVEAVVENVDVKKKVLPDLESRLSEGTIITSNTSTISITELATSLKHPENFCGMHFFNPVHRMPLVEVIRGEKSSPEAINRTVAYAMAMGKTPIVVNDCAGFLVNRLLFPYFNGFLKLIADGCDFNRIDKVMEKFGWPMGPAYLLDVVGLDTAYHCTDVMAEAFPDRMKFDQPTALQGMYDAKRFGQKNGIGFYQYAPDKKGKPKKSADPAVESLIKKFQTNDSAKDASDEDIIDRIMLPMVMEASRCLEEKIVNSPVDVDMGLIYGLGFPPFRGGLFRWVDRRGPKEIVDRAKSFASHGQMYSVTGQFDAMASKNQKFYTA